MHKQITFWKVYRSSHVNDCKFNLEENRDKLFRNNENSKNTASRWYMEHDMFLECHTEVAQIAI